MAELRWGKNSLLTDKNKHKNHWLPVFWIISKQIDMIISKQINKQKNPPWCLEWSSFKGNSGNHSNNFPDMLSDKQNIQIPIFLQAESFIYIDSFSNSFTLCLFSLFISAMSSVVEDKVLSVCFRGFFLTLPANF